MSEEINSKGLDESRFVRIIEKYRSIDIIELNNQVSGKEEKKKNNGE